jgi:hypothetical protein
LREEARAAAISGREATITQQGHDLLALVSLPVGGLLRFQLSCSKKAGEVPNMDEAKIIAAILCAQTIILEDVASDPVAKTVDFYERVLAELRTRGHGGPAVDDRARRRSD